MQIQFTRKILVLSIIASISSISNTTHGQADALSKQISGVEIMEAAQYHGGEIPLSYGIARNWFALEEQGMQSVLRKSMPKVSKVYDAIADEKSNKASYTGKLVSEGKTTPLLFIKASWLQDGVVQKAVKAESAEIYQLGSEQLRVEHQCAKSKSKTEPLKCKIYLSNAKLKQFITEIIEPNEEPSDIETESINVIWSGDLDRDGKLDFVLRNTFYNGERTELYLSSKAGRNEHAKLVASIQRLGC